MPFVPIAEKLRDALMMFWQALDDDERTILLYGGCYLVANVLLSLGARSGRQQQDRLERLELLLAQATGESVPVA